MKKIYSLMLTLLLSVNIYAQWPANYGGVMLQAFYWDSYEDTKWTTCSGCPTRLTAWLPTRWAICPCTGSTSAARSVDVSATCAR